MVKKPEQSVRKNCPEKKKKKSMLFNKFEKERHIQLDLVVSQKMIIVQMDLFSILN